MKHKLILILSLLLMSFLFIVAGALSLSGGPSVDVYFWTRSPIESMVGKVVWIGASTVAFVILLAMAVREWRNDDDRSSR